MQKIAHELREYIATNWPIGSMVASNPWEGFSRQNLAQTLRFLAREIRLQPKPSFRFFLEKIDRYLIESWTKHQGKSYFDFTALWEFLNSDSAEQFASKSLNFKITPSESHFKKWFSDAFLDAIHNEKFRITDSKLQAQNTIYTLELAEILTLIWPMKGWFGLAKWQDENPGHPAEVKIPSFTKLVDIATTLIENYQNTYKSHWLELYHALKHKPVFPKLVDTGFFHNSAEFLSWDYFDTLVFLQELLEYQTFDVLQRNLCRSSQKQYLPLAQWVCCIDVRSEPLRRQLEEIGQFETFGFAGFFGMLVASEDHTSKRWLCPALVKPVKSFNTKSEQAPTNRLTFYPKDQNALAGLGWFDIQAIPSAFKLVKNTLEAWHGKNTVLRTEPIALPDNIIGKNTKHSFLLEEATSVAASVLKSIGLTQNFASFVIITAHKASSRNNPYHSTLECGACGGNSGELNAALLAYLLNDLGVREGLQKEGICIPAHTKFLSACHDTTTQSLKIFSDEKNSPLFQELVERSQLAIASLQKSAKDSLNARKKILRGSGFDELNPDWALLNNYAMIIGSRKRTEHINLNAEVFLHSYDYKTDKNGAILETILTAPVLVAHQINMQYLTSSLYPDDYGSGSKTLQSIIPGIGNVLGNGSDLTLGLPKQSIFWQDKLLHNPRRLIVLIDAPKEMIINILTKHDILHTLWKNGWIQFGSIHEKITPL